MGGIISTTIFVGAAVVGFVAFVCHRYSKAKPFHIEVDQPFAKGGVSFLMLIFKVMMSIVPETTRKNLVSKLAAPYSKRLDRYDFSGKSPYTVEEVDTGRLWKVSYDQESGLFTNDKEYKEFKAFMELDLMSDSFEEKLITGARTQGEVFVDVVKSDLPTIRHWAAKRERGDKEVPSEDVEKMWYHVLNMFVIKLASGSLMLYAPVTVREELGEFCTWLDNLGTVEWIVVPCASHTLHLKAIIQRYPDAKIIGPAAAEAKIKLVMDLLRGEFDYHATNEEELVAVNKILAADDVQVFNVAGDVNNAVLVRVNKTLLECDLVYGHDDGEGISGCNGHKMRKCEPDDWAIRMWKFTLVNKPHSPQGFIPNYRYWLMDPNSMSLLMYDAAPRDGSYCGLMANSLRKMMKLKFDRALGVHGIDMSKEKFGATIDKSWNWLDGASLLES